MGAHGSQSHRMMRSDVITMIPAQEHVMVPLMLGWSGAAVLTLSSPAAALVSPDTHAQVCTTTTMRNSPCGGISEKLTA